MTGARVLSRVARDLSHVLVSAPIQHQLLEAMIALRIEMNHKVVTQLFVQVMKSKYQSICLNVRKVVALCIVLSHNLLARKRTK